MAEMRSNAGGREKESKTIRLKKRGYWKIVIESIIFAGDLAVTLGSIGMVMPPVFKYIGSLHWICTNNSGGRLTPPTLIRRNFQLRYNCLLTLQVAKNKNWPILNTNTI